MLLPIGGGVSVARRDPGPSVIIKSIFSMYIYSFIKRYEWSKKNNFTLGSVIVERVENDNSVPGRNTFHREGSSFFR